MKRLFVAMGMLLALQSLQASDLYRWVDKEGKVHYGDRPEEDAERVKITIPETDAASGVDASVPYEARFASKKFPVTLYVSEGCGSLCQQARDFLNKRHVPFREKVLKTEEDLASFKAQSGNDTVPALSVGRNWVRGFQPDEWRVELDSAGYPK